MQLVIYEDERVEVSRAEDGYHRVRIWRNGMLRLTVETRSNIITFINGDSVLEENN